MLAGNPQATASLPRKNNISRKNRVAQYSKNAESPTHKRTRCSRSSLPLFLHVLLSIVVPPIFLIFHRCLAHFQPAKNKRTTRSPTYFPQTTRDILHAQRDTPRFQPPAFGVAQVNEAAKSAAAACVCVHESVKKGGGRGEGAPLLWVGNPVACDRMIRLTTLVVRSPWVYVRTTMHIRPWELARPPYVTTATAATRGGLLRSVQRQSPEAPAHTCSDTRACRIKVPRVCVYTVRTHGTTVCVFLVALQTANVFR